MKPQGVIFDFNGTLLLDSPLHEQAWLNMAAQLFNRNLTLSEYHNHIHGRTNKAIIGYLLQREPSVIELHQFQEAKENYYRQLCIAQGPDFKLAPGVEPFLDALKALQIPITIATGSYWGNVVFYLQHLNLIKWFDPELIVFDDMVRPGKPAPDVFVQAAHNIKLHPAQCVVFEDSLSGVKAAKAANIGRIITVEPTLLHADLALIGGVFLATNGFGNINLQTIGF
jgi:HAD superfamily hydrolase (TIGR01509 family)